MSVKLRPGLAHYACSGYKWSGITELSGIFVCLSHMNVKGWPSFHSLEENRINVVGRECLGELRMT